MAKKETLKSVANFVRVQQKLRKRKVDTNAKEYAKIRKQLVKAEMRKRIRAELKLPKAKPKKDINSFLKEMNQGVRAVQKY